jgi:hypothetical protein
VLVEVAVVGGMPVSVVNVAQMAAVEHRGVAASLTMHMDMLLGMLVLR